MNVFSSMCLLTVFLVTAQSCNTSPEISLLEDHQGLTVKAGERTILTYHMALQYPPDTLPAYYRRSGFIHPLYSPGGVLLTDGFPVGHVHQHGLFLAFANTTYRGQPVDFWNQQRGIGTVRHDRLLEKWETDQLAGFRVALQHLAIMAEDTLVVLNEEWKIKVHEDSTYYVIDLTSRIVLHGLDTLYLNEYLYGGLGFRGSSEWNDLSFEQPGHVNYIGTDGKGGFLTSEGKTRVDGNHSHERWVSFHGQVEGDSAGVVIMVHPDSWRFPQAVRIHPVMPYFTFSPVVDGPFAIAPGDTLVSRYRILTHDGLPDVRSVEKAWHNYLNPQAKP